MMPFTFERARTAREAAERLAAGAADGACLLAGGTELVPLLKDGLLTSRRVVWLAARDELRTLSFDNQGSLRIGALSTLADVERDSTIAARLPILAQAVGDAATPQLRAMATVAGNLLQRNRCWYFRGPYACWLKGGAVCFAREGENGHAAIFDTNPCVAVQPSDLAPALVALDAEVALVSPRGERVVPVAELLATPSADDRRMARLGADEVIVAVRVPAQPEGAQGVYLKVMERQAWAFALVSAAAQVAVRDGRVARARLVLGGVAAIPWAVRAAAELLEGQPPSAERVAAVAERAVEGAAPLAGNGYKLAIARALARRALLAALGLPA